MANAKQSQGKATCKKHKRTRLPVWNPVSKRFEIPPPRKRPHNNTHRDQNWDQIRALVRGMLADNELPY